MNLRSLPPARHAILEDRVLRVAGIRVVEAALLAASAPGRLMERAGEAVAAAALDLASDRGGSVVLLAGPGNNGGDALVAARCLHARGVDVRVAVLGDPAAYRGDAAGAWQRWQSAVGSARPDRDASRDVRPAIGSASLIVDGLFGIGSTRPPTGIAREWIALANASGRPILAVDVPSGVDADTGCVADIAIEADRTLTFLGRKPGLETGDGLEHAGEVVVDLLGSGDDPAAAQSWRFAPGDVGAINHPALFTHHWPRRRLNGHKGTYGSVAVVGGHDGMVGAALLASRMALHAGAGRVYVRLLARQGPALDLLQPELMLRTSLDGVDASAWAIGPGLGHDDAGLAALADALDAPAPIVADADALNAIAKDAALGARLAGRTARGLPPAVLTPHPLEAARLLGTDAKTVQADRVGAALRLATQTGSVVVLKGAGSVIAAPDGAWTINRTGNPALATGGTGDVLCGLIGSLLAQGMPPLDGARAGTWLHGTAADDLVAAGTGPVGVTASEVIVAVRSAINRLAATIG